MILNELAASACQTLIDSSARYRVSQHRNESGARIIDCGVKVSGGLDAGRILARTCLSDLGQVELHSGDLEIWPGPWVQVSTDHPVAACLASQYAGWQVSLGNYSAIASGPMRAARGREALFEEIGFQESPDQAVGILEVGQLPEEEVCRYLAEECRISAENLTLLVAPTASIAGSLQVVARTVETALHKLHEIGFDLTKLVSGFGTAPLPPVAASDLATLGRTNDAILYAGQVTLWARTTDDELNEFGPQVPSSASADHGAPFAEVFERYDRDFYKIDPMLFSPAVVMLHNFETGSCFRFGEVDAQVLHRSFGI